MSGSYYDTAQICMNGHAITSNASHSEMLSKYCIKCGEKTIKSCQHCNSKIRGYFHVPGVISLSQYIPPKYCHECGKPYPWTETSLMAAKEFAEDLDNITPEEQETLKKSLDDLVKEGPRTVVATSRFKRIVSKAGTGAASTFRDILVDVVSESVKKGIWGS